MSHVLGDLTSVEQAVRKEYRARVEQISLSLLLTLMQQGMMKGMVAAGAAIATGEEQKDAPRSKLLNKDHVEHAVIMAKLLCDLTDEVQPSIKALEAAKKRDETERKEREELLTRLENINKIA